MGGEPVGETAFTEDRTTLAVGVPGPRPPGAARVSLADQVVTNHALRAPVSRQWNLRQYRASGVREEPMRPVQAMPAAYSSSAHWPL